MYRNRFLWKNLNFKKKFQKNEIKRLSLKYLFLQEKSNKKLYYNFLLSKFSRLSNLSRIRNYCLVTGQSRSVYRQFGLSRMILKDWLSKGLIKSFKKAGW